MATLAIDGTMLETLLIQALATCDQAGYDQVGAHVAMALDALHRARRMARDRCETGEHAG